VGFVPAVSRSWSSWSWWTARWALCTGERCRSHLQVRGGVELDAYLQVPPDDRGADAPGVAMKLGELVSVLSVNGPVPGRGASAR